MIYFDSDNIAKASEARVKTYTAYQLLAAINGSCHIERTQRRRALADGAFVLPPV